MNTMDSRLRGNILVGRIVAPQGLRGEIRVQTFTENPMDLKKLSIINHQLSIVRQVPNSDVVIAKIDGINDRNAAETLRGTELFINRDDLPDLADGEYYQTDLVGSVVSRQSSVIGKVSAVHNFGAGDILELDNGEMVSFNGADVDLKNKTINL